MPVTKEIQSQWYIPKDKIKDASVSDYRYKGPCKRCGEKVKHTARGLCQSCYMHFYNRGRLANGSLMQYKTFKQRAVTARVTSYAECKICGKIKQKVHAQSICWSCYRKRYPVKNSRGKVYKYNIKERMANGETRKITKREMPELPQEKSIEQ